MSAIPTMSLEKDESVYILTLNGSKVGNTFTPDVIREYEAVFDEIESTTENASLLIKSDDPKNWCNGIDTEWLATIGNTELATWYNTLDRCFLRASLLNLPTVACINGHCFGGGAILAGCLDFRVMREDRGWFCFPEVDIKIPFSLAMHAVVDNFIDPKVAKNMLLRGERVGAPKAIEYGAIDAMYKEENLYANSLELAKELAQKDRTTYNHIKQGIRRDLRDLKYLFNSGLRK